MEVKTDSIGKIAQLLRKENDRSVAIIGASLIEVQLEELLSKGMIDHKEVPSFFKGYAPLASLSAKASLAVFLGLIPVDVFKDITYIRKIRNEFAHSHEDIDFSKPPISDFISNLISVKWFLYCMPLADKPITKAEEEEIRTVPRRTFDIAASIISWHLDRYVEAIQKPEAKKGAFIFPPHLKS
jgi:hypothetical protein